jgi:outer membrane protein, multidrug efflux system
VASYLEVLDADTKLFSAELDLAKVRQGELLASVQLYRALGGGWRGLDEATTAARDDPAAIARERQ